MKIVQKIVRKFVCILVRMLTRTEFIGTENISKEGGMILAINHMSRIDLPVLILMTNDIRADMTAFVAARYKSSLIFRFLVPAIGAIWIDRTKADFTAFRTGIDFLNNGGLLGVSPEGTRSRNGAMIEAKPGTVIAALKADVIIVPVGVMGSENTAAQWLRLRRPKIIVRAGKPFKLPMLENENRKEILQSSTDEIMCRIAALLPDKYHGFYAGHPRVKEIQLEGA